MKLEKMGVFSKGCNPRILIPATASGAKISNSVNNATTTVLNSDIK